MPMKVLMICGSLNQTSQMRQIAEQLPGLDIRFTPYYGDGLIDLLRRAGLAESTVLGEKLRSRCLSYLTGHGLLVDDGGREGGYDLVVTCSDLVIQRNIRDRKIVLVQEGMTDPENFAYRLVRAFPLLPRWLASTATTGMSNRFNRFCVASEGYRELFVRKGVDPGRIVVTGIPNFDDCARYRQNDFPYRGYVLVCTSDMRETFVYENRRALIEKAVRIAAGRQLIFKLHPNERFARATREIERWAPGALIYTEGKAEEMIANCDVLITRRSSVVYVGLALGKETYSDFHLDDLRRLVPDQHGRAAQNIAGIVRSLLDDPASPAPVTVPAVSFRRSRRASRRHRYARALSGLFTRAAG
jgi:hypothetical protein